MVDSILKIVILCQKSWGRVPTTLYLHIWQILEYKSLVEFGIQILAVNFGFVFWFLVGKKINLDEWICESGGPVRGWQVATLDNLTAKIFGVIVRKYFRE